MAVKTVKVILDELKFPEFVNDDSKKNFRILATFECVDKDLKPTHFDASLPPLSKNNWQWRKSGKTNFLANDGHGRIDFAGTAESNRIFLREQTDIRGVNFKIIDVKDMNTLDFAAPILKKALELGLGGIPGTGVFSAVVDAAKAQAGDLLEQKIDELVNSGDKLLFEMDFPPPPKDEKTIKPGAYTVEGQGVLKDKTDKLGHYEIKFRIVEVPV